MPPETARKINSFWISAAAAGLVIVGVVCIVITSRLGTPEKFVWLTADQVGRTLKPGRFTQLKYKVLSWPGPWRWFASQKTQVLVATRLLALPKHASFEIEHATFCFTNTTGHGGRAWIIAPEELSHLNMQLNIQSKMLGAMDSSNMRLTTLSGGPARISTGYSLPTTPSLFCGVTADILPTAMNGSFKLLLGITATGPSGSSSSGAVTNVSLGCRALVPNGGALVIDAGNSDQSSATNYWLIISSTAVDAKGNPIKLRN